MRLFGFGGPPKPPHCPRCGLQMGRREYVERYRPKDGTPVVRRWWACPRNPSARPDAVWYDGDHEGQCTSPPHFACSEQIAAWQAGRPWQTGCTHTGHTEDGIGSYD